MRGRRKEKEKLPSGITADYSADFFAALNADLSGNNASGENSGYELDRGNEEIVASITTTIESRHNGASSILGSVKVRFDKMGFVQWLRVINPTMHSIYILLNI